jgi:hypothetical protein
MYTSMTENDVMSTLFFHKNKDCCKLLSINELGQTGQGDFS